jgi:hypothetical protein
VGAASISTSIMPKVIGSLKGLPDKVLQKVARIDVPVISFTSCLDELQVATLIQGTNAITCLEQLSQLIFPHLGMIVLLILMFSQPWFARLAFQDSAGGTRDNFAIEESLNAQLITNHLVESIFEIVLEKVLGNERVGFTADALTLAKCL